MSNELNSNLSVISTKTRWLTQIILVLVTDVATVPDSQAEPHFTEITDSAGVTYLQNKVKTGQVPYRMSGGAAVGDVDGDGLIDLFVTRMDEPDILFRNMGDVDGDGNVTFEDWTEEAGLAEFNLQSNGAVFGDIDNDGDLDLYITIIGEAGDSINNRNYLFINLGNGVFVEEAVARGVAVATEFQHRGYGATFGDYDRDGWLDLHTTEWHPNAKSHSRLFRNLGASAPGHFEDITESAGVNLDNTYGFSSAFSDLDNDGWPDLVVSGDFGTSRLFWNNRNGTFSDGTTAAGVGTDENGMGSSIADYNGDGLLDWFVTSILDPFNTCESQGCGYGATGNRLYKNKGDRLFEDATDDAGVRDGAWGWGTAIFDYDNDGDLDIVMTNGSDFSVTQINDPFINTPMRLWENDGNGVMTEKAASVGLGEGGNGRGLLIFDYDADGDLDLFVIQNFATPRLYRNDGGNTNDWLRVQTIGTVSNREGVGARVIIEETLGGRKQIREISSVTHYLGQSERVAHFGLGSGDTPVASVTVTWPSGQFQQFTNVDRNITLVVVEEFPDDDGDGVLDDSDAFPLNKNESADTDSDGMGDNYENTYGLDPDDAGDANLDKDSDGLSNLEEFLAGRNPLINEAAVIMTILGND